MILGLDIEEFAARILVAACGVLVVVLLLVPA